AGLLGEHQGHHHLQLDGAGSPQRAAIVRSLRNPIRAREPVMGLSQALNTAMSGLRATQASLALVSSNVANAETPGYVEKTGNPGNALTGDYGSSVLVNGVNRQLDAYLQSQVRTETSG